MAKLSKLQSEAIAYAINGILVAQKMQQEACKNPKYNHAAWLQQECNYWLQIQAAGVELIPHQKALADKGRFDTFSRIVDAKMQKR